MNRETLVPSIPDIRDDNIKDVLRAIKSTLDVREGNVGDPLDQLVTLRELRALNLVDGGGSTTITGASSLPVTPVIVRPPDNYNPATDTTTPPAPTGLEAFGSLTNVFLRWDGAPYRNHAYTEIWRATVDNLGQAVLVSTTISNVYSDPVAPDTEYFYWIRFVSAANITGPYNGTAGTCARTAFDVAANLPALQDSIRSSSLFIDLGARIQSIESSAILTASQLALLQDARAQLQQQVSANGSAILSTQKINKTQATLITALGTRVGTAESSIVNLQSTTATQATQISSLTTRVGTAESSITSLQSTTSTQATQLSTLTTRVGTAESSITSLQTTTANQATSISNLNSTVSGNSTSISTLQTTTNGLSAQYSIKIDNNGHVSGFGLASTPVNGTPSSAFIVRADRFAIAGPNDPSDPLGTLTPSRVPFIVLTSPTTVNGKTYPAGTWMDTAFIANATITDAQITTLTATKITTGTLTAAISVNTGQIYGGVNPNTGWAPGSVYFGTGYFLGNWGGVNQFYIGSPSKYLLWNGTDLTVKGVVYANAGAIGSMILDANGLSSSNYSAGSTGFAINNNGSMDINNGTFRGTIAVKSGASGARTEISNAVIKVYDSNGTLRVKIGDLSA